MLVFVEHASGEADRVSLETLAFARGLASSLGGVAVEALLIGPGAELGPSLGAHGVATAHVVEDAAIAGVYAPGAWGAALASLATARGAAAVLAPGSDRGAEVLAHAAARLGLPSAANVLSVIPGDPWRLTRQRWAGSLLEDATLDGPMRLLSVAPHAVPVDERPGSPAAAIAQFSPSVSAADLAVRVTGHEAPAAGSVSLSDAKVVVGGGRGVGSAAAFSELEELADLLGGAVGVSRVVTSNGWRPHTQQVGQTGQRIAPDLYIACGISGAIQHIVGCKAAKRILAINTDPESPIMSVADFAVIGDLHAVLPAISAEIRRRRGHGQ
ncbi:MAG: electron transfer flavoprotein subunit alpha/FixB family protein [Chloroflexota bacterium]|nr:MAG: electron transfer flavoprotein subunit alpha/FixB family protein [Chloroflexota bacterium]